MPSEYQRILDFTCNSIAKFALKHFKPIDPGPVMTHRDVSYLSSFGTVRVGTAISLKIGT